MYKDCQEFTKLYYEKTRKSSSGKIDKKFIRKMVLDELDELDVAKDEAEEVDALLDATYYILQHLATTGLNIDPIWKLIHNANMTKFEKGYRRSDGKWCKPKDFKSPDDDIRKEILKQKTQK